MCVYVHICMCVYVAHTSVSLSKRMSLFLKISLDQQGIHVCILREISKTGCNSVLEQRSERNCLVRRCSATLDGIVQKTFAL